MAQNKYSFIKLIFGKGDIDGYNGLHRAVDTRRLSKMKYLWDNVYKNDEIKKTIFDQTAAMNGKHIFIGNTRNNTRWIVHF